MKTQPGFELQQIFGDDAALIATNPDAERVFKIAHRRFNPDSGEVRRAWPGREGLSMLLPLRVISGQKIWLGDELIHSGPLERGSAAIFDLKDRPSFSVQDSFDAISVHLSWSLLNQYIRRHSLSPVQEFKIILGQPDTSIVHLGLAVVALLHQPQSPSPALIDHIVNALCAHVLRCESARAPETTKRGGLAPWQLRKATERMKSNLDGKITLAEVASGCGMSVSHFVRSFKHTVGDPPLRWLGVQRIEAAKKMLSGSGSAMDQISRKCGYADQTCFIRAFRQRTGLTPGEWRRQSFQ